MPSRLLALPRLARTTIAALTGGDIRRAPAAARTVWRARVRIAGFLATGDPALAARLRREFGLAPETDRACGLPLRLFSSEQDGPAEPATVLIPVHDAHDDTARLLERLPQTLAPDQPVILIDDGSRDPRTAGLLEQFAARHRAVRLLRHASNQGFVAAVATGLANVAPDHHVVLLNTDTLPPEGWLPRLLAPIAADPSIASVTPMSNTAEILSVPTPGHAPDLTTESVDLIDRRARDLAPRDIPLPTGIGFCMALNRRFLDRIGGFDPVFGRGYGEEVDWCLRASAAGGRHVVQTRLFIGHRGGASFGAEEKAWRIRAASAVVEARHPGYEKSVRDWIEAQPVEPERIALSLVWLAATSHGRVPVFLGHMLGGGAETALRREIEGALSSGAPGVVVIRVGGPRAWRIEVLGPEFRTAGDTDDAAMIHDLLAPVERRSVVYSCGVGAADPAGVPVMLANLLRAPGSRFEMRLHDFFPVSPSWNLLDSTGRYTGIPDEGSRDPAHAVRRRGRKPLTLAEWRALWRPLVVRADEITVFAPSGAPILQRAYPESVTETVLRPHPLPALPGPLPLGGESIGVLGGINRAKGGAVLTRLARATERRIVVIGNMDGQFRLPPPHVVHGLYAQEQIAQLAAEFRVGLWLIPSICPETFSFATHEALSTGLPVAGFNLGAQADALGAAPNGHVLKVGPEDAPERLAEALESLYAASTATPPVTSRRAS